MKASALITKINFVLGLLHTQTKIIRYYSVFGCNSAELWLTVGV